MEMAKNHRSTDHSLFARLLAPPSERATRIVGQAGVEGGAMSILAKPQLELPPNV